MALSIEWERRIKVYLEHLPQRFTREVGTVELSGFTTTEQLTPAKALRGRFKPMRVGTKWGQLWEYAWFKTTVRIPREADGKWVVLSSPQGQENYVLVNGAHVGQPQGWKRRLVCLSRRAKAGERYDILMEAYAGHGPTPCSAGPMVYGKEVWTDAKPPLREVARSTIEIWQEDAFQLYIDMATLWDVRNIVDANSLRRAEIDAALREVTTVVDFELPTDEMLQSMRRGRAVLMPLLACVNGTTAPTMHCFGHAHLDVAWLWPLRETESKMVRTISNTLSLAAEYPEYRFLQSQAHLFLMMKEHYPDLYRRIKAAVAKGNIVPEGAMWVEADTNITGGESLIRQCLHGKRFFQQEFGVDTRVLWLPDVFGYSAALPQILRGCGVDYFTTQKIYWTYNGGEPFPLMEFTWEGIDGSAVIAHLHMDYNSRTNPASIQARWADRPQKEGFNSRLLPFGWGDGGGGPEREHLEFLRRCRDLEGVPRTKMSSPAEFFAELEQRGVAPARHVGELYFQAHRGVMTTQAKTKRGNRKSEIALREAELWACAAQALKGARYPRAALDRAWKKLLLNQFHDILPGSSIARVYREAEKAFGETIAEATAVADNSLRRLAGGSKKSLAAFNSLSWARTEVVPVPDGVDARKLAAPTQSVARKTYVEVGVPACGWTTVRAGAAPAVANALKATPHLLENEVVRLAFNNRGEITSIFDKEAGQELAAGPCNAMAMFRDTPVQSEAWDIDSSYKTMPVAIDTAAKVAVVAAGPLVAVLRVTRRLNNSTMSQEIALRRGSRRVDFRTQVDWQEKRKLLKVCFPVNIHADHAVHEIQFGHVCRPNHESRPFDADRFEVAQQKWTALMESARGVAVLNDCKYGVNVAGGSINLTLLRSPQAPDKTADRGRQEFAYALYAWNGPFAQSDLLREAYALNVPLQALPGDAGERSLFSLDAANVVIESVKFAEDGAGDCIVRLYEAAGTATRCQLAFGLPVKRCRATDMLERGGKALPVKGGSVALALRAFEIKTLRVS
jgi:alpha-mannosidase